jgi:hypothetical protein
MPQDRKAKHHKFSVFLGECGSRTEMGQVIHCQLDHMAKEEK